MRGKEPTATSKRFPIGQIPEYDSAYSMRMQNSWILNEGLRKNSLDFFTRLTTITDCQNELIDLLGYESGSNKEYTKDSNGNFQKAKLSSLKAKLSEIENQISNYFQGLINQGIKSDRNHCPKSYRLAFYDTLAEIDIIRLETIQIKKLIESFEKEESKVVKTNVLKHGLTLDGKLKGGILAEIGNQKVSVYQGKLIIDDELSPYDGMSVEDYREFAKQWIEQKRKSIMEARKMQEKEIGEKGHSSIVVPSLTHSVRREDLPAFPKWAKNFKKNTNKKPS